MCAKKIERRCFIRTGSAVAAVGAGCCLSSVWAEEQQGDAKEPEKKPAREPIAYCGLDCRICNGCKDFCRGERISKFCANCKIRACAKRRKEESCGSCEEYTTCKLVNSHLDKNKSKKWAQNARKRLEAIKEKSAK